MESTIAAKKIEKLLARRNAQQSILIIKDIETSFWAALSTKILMISKSMCYSKQ